MTSSDPPQRSRRTWVYEIILIYILLMGAYFRFVGINWGEYQYLHPDERFLIWVGTDISPVKSLADYFNTANSSLNPNNRGHGFYVYGTLPMFMARYLVQEVYGHSGFNEMTNVGRALSAIIDLLTVYFVFLVAERLYNRRAGLLAAAFYALMVLPIQQSHFFTTDTFINFFTFLAIFFSVVVVTKQWEETSESDSIKKFFSHPLFLSSLLFGVALGCAVSSKISAAPVAIMLPGAVLVRVMQLPAEKRMNAALKALPYLIMAGFVSVLVFRIFQPYAFSGPGFFGIKPNPSWVAQMKELKAGSAGDIDYPFALQWARRPVWFSGENLVLWGLGIPLGILAWAGFLWMGWRILKGEWKQHILLWGWVAFYFTWQSLAFNPTMRYQLPIYPALAVFAGWAVIQLWERGSQLKAAGAAIKKKLSTGNLLHLAALFVGLVVVLLTFAWAFAFTRICVRPITRVAASRWIYQNVPGPINLHIQTPAGLYNQPINYPEGYTIQSGAPYLSSFTAQADGSISTVTIGYLVDQSANAENTIMRLIISKQPGGGEPLASSVINTDLTMNPNRKDQSAGFNLDRPLMLTFQEKYYLTLELQTEDRNIGIDGPVTLNIQNGSNPINQQLANPRESIRENSPFYTTFTALQSG
ncbi:MAG: ArnT family glycosyltransferase, partial [Omnitrophica WOR_2 bacterium]